MEYLAEIQAGWSDESKWPTDLETTPNNFQLASFLRKQHAWMKGLVNAVKQLQTENKNLRDEVAELKGKRPVALDWTKINAGLVHKDENAVAMMATIATEMRKKEERVNNVIASIPVSAFSCNDGGETEYAGQLASKIGIPATRVKKARRISRRPGEQSTTANSRVLLVVEMESATAKLEMLRSARKLREIESHKDIYINEDLTPSERIADQKLRQERDKRNNQLTGTETADGRSLKFKVCEDGKKRFWAIRNGELRLVLSALERL